MTAIAYPRLIKRVRAVLIDSVLLPLAVFGTLIIGNAAGISSTLGRVILVLAPILILEPGMVAFTGGTIGHHLLKIRIARLDGKRNINFFAATLRFLLKMLLGWLSFIFVLTTTRHQAVHDLVARSVVIHKDTAGLPVYDVQVERRLDSSAYVYPPWWRRVAVIIVYLIGVTVVVSVVIGLVFTPACMQGNQCTTLDLLFEVVLSILWLVGMGWFIVQGWNGMVYGSRKRQRVSIGSKMEADIGNSGNGS